MLDILGMGKSLEENKAEIGTDGSRHSPYQGLGLLISSISKFRPHAGDLPV